MAKTEDDGSLGQYGSNGGAKIDQILNIFWRLSQQDFLIDWLLDMRVREIKNDFKTFDLNT